MALDLPGLTRRVVADHVRPYAAAVDRERRFPDAGVRGLAEAGLLGLLVPEADRGPGGSLTDLAVVTEALAAACASTAMCFVMHNSVVAGIAGCAAPGRRDGLLDELRTGARLGSVAFSVDGRATTDRLVRRDGEMLEVTATRPYVTGGDRLGVVLLIVDETMLAVPLPTPGASFTGTWDGAGMAGNNSTTLVLDRVELSSTHVVGAPGAGQTVRGTVTRPPFLIGLAALYVGIAAAATDAAAVALHDRQDREVNDVSLGQLVARVAAARALVRSAAAVTVPGDPGLPLAAMEAKLVATGTAVEVTTAALRLCGGRGYARSAPFERHVRDALAGPVMIPISDDLAAMIGRHHLDHVGHHLEHAGAHDGEVRDD